MPETAERLRDRARAHGIPVPLPIEARLVAYFDLLTRWNAKINLTALTDTDAAIDRLLLEPLAAAPSLPSQLDLLDLGSGGGSPAIPLALAARRGNGGIKGPESAFSGSGPDPRADRVVENHAVAGCTARMPAGSMLYRFALLARPPSQSPTFLGLRLIAPLAPGLPPPRASRRPPGGAYLHAGRLRTFGSARPVMFHVEPPSRLRRCGGQAERKWVTVVSAFRRNHVNVPRGTW